MSKYTRIAQWCAERGTLQEELANDIAREIMKATGSKDIGVYVQATHGCVENRGVQAHSSPTQTTVLKGTFKDEAKVQKEFMDNIKLPNKVLQEVKDSNDRKKSKSIRYKQRTCSC